MAKLGVLLCLVATAGLMIAGSTAVAGTAGQAQASAKSKYAKCKAKKRAKAKKKCRRNVKRKLKLDRQAKNTWWVDYAGVASRRPGTIALSDPDAFGMVIQKVKWKKWGYAKPSGQGVIITAGFFPGAPGISYPITFKPRSPFSCKAKWGTKKGKRIFVYRKVTLTLKDPTSGQVREMDISSVAGSQVCKAPASS